MFDYVTYKYVRLRDSKLGALYYILALLILIYSLVEIFFRKGYMQVFLVKATCSVWQFKLVELRNTLRPKQLLYG